MSIERALEKMKSESAHLRHEPPRLTSLQRAKQVLGLRHPAKPAARSFAHRVEPDPVAVRENRVLLLAGADDPRPRAAYRILRTRLLHKMHASGWTSVAITSPGAGEGKSLTTLNLALSIAHARAGEVFLIDLDLRSPSVFRYLGVHPPFDLTRFFRGEGQPADVFASVGPDNLAIAGSAEPTEFASELLASTRLDELLAAIPTLASDPIVLIDLPPLLVTDEALLVAPRADAVALVVREGRTRRDGLERAKHLLDEFPLAGVILNDATDTFAGDGYYGYAGKYGPAPTAKS